jgi:iron complex outermembrane receptor protein
MLCILRAALTAAAACAVAISTCYAQSPPEGAVPPTPIEAEAATPESGALSDVGGESLPPIVVQQVEPPKRPAPPKKATALREPSAPRRAVTVAEPPPAPEQTATGEANPLVNPGTPSAGVVPIMGAASAPAAQTVTAVDVSRLESEPLFSVGDILRQSPGISLKQGNGPRDIGISIRGSNARNGFGIRNIVIFDDGFPVTQPDGLSRSDLIDPHAYSGVDVWRGPSSALFGNYATGGALNFRTWPGGTIDGIEYGLDRGSFDYWNNYLLAGTRTQRFEGGLFLSDVRGDGYYGYSAFNTQTANLLATYKLTSRDTITLKGIDNQLYTELPFRMSLDQFKENPFQKGCATAAKAAPGCVTNNFSATNTSPFVPQTAEEDGANRDDRRSIGGVRWEHEFDADTMGRVQFVIDDRNINQPTGTTSAIGDFLSYNVIADVTRVGNFAGLPAKYLLGSYWNTLPVDSKTYYVAPGGNARLGELQSTTQGSTTNLGARGRQELALTPNVIMTAGVAVEKSWIEGVQHSFTYDALGTVLTDTPVVADRSMTNVAPEIGLLWKPSTKWQYRARVGTGYGIPQLTNLFVTPEGVPGNNTELKTQTNIGYDLGVDWTPLPRVMLSLTGFYEFFTNEFVSQSAGPGLMNYTYNVPRSEHRGIEVAADIAIAKGLRFTAAYLYNDQFYTEYEERLSGSDELFDRAGNKIPGVAPNELTMRLSYDQPAGALRGLGAFAEYQMQDGFFMENANLLVAPGYGIVNVNVHYNTELGGGPLRTLMAYAEIRNLFDETYISSANNITDRIGATPTTLAAISGSIYSGAPRSYFAGFKMRF